MDKIAEVSFKAGGLPHIVEWNIDVKEGLVHVATLVKECDGNSSVVKRHAIDTYTCKMTIE